MNDKLVAKKVAETPEVALLRELFAAAEVTLVNHKGPAIERLRAAYEPLTESRR